MIEELASYAIIGFVPFIVITLLIRYANLLKWSLNDYIKLIKIFVMLLVTIFGTLVAITITGYIIAVFVRLFI